MKREMVPPPTSLDSAPLNVKSVEKGTVRGALMTAVGASTSAMNRRACTGFERLPAASIGSFTFSCAEEILGIGSVPSFRLVVSGFSRTRHGPPEGGHYRQFKV